MDTTIYFLDNAKEPDIWFNFLMCSYEIYTLQIESSHNWQVLLH